MNEVAAHFDRVARDYERLRGRGPLGRWARRERSAVAGLVAIRNGQRVLDAGCGPGWWAAWCRDAGARAVGVDVSRRMAGSCRRRGCAAVVADFAVLPFGSAFDHVLCIGSLEFAAAPERVLAEFARVLRPGGRLVLLYPRASLRGLAYRLYHRTHGVHIRLFGAQEVDRMLAAAGLRRVAGPIDCGLSAACAAVRDDRRPGLRALSAAAPGPSFSVPPA